MKRQIFSANQELLLRASLLKTKEAVSAWDEFKSSVDINRIDYGSLRMLPLLYKNFDNTTGILTVTVEERAVGGKIRVQVAFMEGGKPCVSEITR